jgi:hypothetical protein
VEVARETLRDADFDCETVGKDGKHPA